MKAKHAMSVIQERMGFLASRILQRSTAPLGERQPQGDPTGYDRRELSALSVALLGLEALERLENGKAP